MVIKILAFILMGIGTVIIFAADQIVDKFGLAERTSYGSSGNELNKEDIMRIKREQATLQIKKYGLFIITPAVILILIVFR